MRKIFYILALCLATFSGWSQAQILSANISSFNITPRGMLEVNIMNSRAEEQVVLTAKLVNSKGEALLTVTTAPFLLSRGMSNTAQSKITIASAIYASNDQATQVKNNHSLPSGKYTYCASINAIDVSDEYCQDIESDYSSFLFLVSPPDKDVIETKQPILVWTHSDPFSLSNQNDYYRIVVTDLYAGQSAEAAINTNIPVYMKNYLSMHQVQYPIDAKELKAGQTYAWQVQRISNGAIVNKTEAWEFKLKGPDPIKENKYARLKKNLDGTLYMAEGNKIFFRFDEDYAGKKMSYKILNEKQQAVTAPEATEVGERVKMDAVKDGYNTYMIDLNRYKIPAGIYVLEVTSEKKEMYKLKFQVE
jgi:hypothetical protein